MEQRGYFNMVKEKNIWQPPKKRSMENEGKMKTFLQEEELNQIVAIRTALK